MAIVLYESDQIREASKQLKSLVDSIPKQIERLEKEMSLCDRERSDILHLIELHNFNASQGYRYSKDLQITMKRRREIKNELDVLKNLRTELRTHRPLRNQVARVGKVFDDSDKRIKSRKYTPRIRTDLSEIFKKL